MKKYFFYLTSLTGMLLLSFSTSAQQAKQTDASAKPPVAIGKKLDSDKSKSVPDPVVAPASTDKDLPSTAGAKSSQDMPKLTKGNEQKQAKADQTYSQPSSTVPQRTDNLVAPKHGQEIRDAVPPPVPAKIKE